MLRQSGSPVQCNTEEVGSQTMRVNGTMYTLEGYAEQLGGPSDMVDILVRQKTTKEVVKHYGIIREIAFALDKKFKCETRISADGGKNPLIVIPRKVLPK